MHLDVVSDPSVSKRDLYILSRLNLCITESNQHLSEYNFGAVASTLHSFFLYDLCDVYLELIKPIVTDTSEENKGRRRCAQIALYTCLEQYLRLCHPLMPFVTEELWQRMPSREAMCSDPSIMIAAYPEPIASYDNPAAEASMDVVKKAIAGARSLRADYKIANHVKADFYFRSDFEDVREALSEQGIDVCTLSKGNFLQYLEKEQEAPKGCTVKILNERCSLLVNLTGIIDIAQEIQRMNKEIDRIVPSIEQYKKKMQAPGYDKVPEKVRETNTVKVASLEAELAAIREAVTQFESMRL
jgi:valyl-tRNA synthetase